METNSSARDNSIADDFWNQESAEDAFDAEASLPLHMRSESYHQYVLKRTKEQARRYGLPWLSTCKDPLEGAELRDALHTMACVAAEREGELRLYHQSRVFQQVLGRAVDALRGFMSEPLPIVPNSWRKRVTNQASVKTKIGKEEALSQPPSSEGASDESAGAANQGNPKQSGDSNGARNGGFSASPAWRDWAAGLTAAMLTPKWILAAAVGVILALTGVNQWQLSMKDQAIAQYESATKALNENVTALQASMLSHDEDLRVANEQSAEQRNRAVQAEKKLGETLESLRKAEKEIAVANDRLEQRAADDTEAQQQLTEAQNELQTVQAELAAAQERVRNLEADNKEYRNTQSEFSTTNAELQRLRGAVQRDLDTARLDLAAALPKANMYYHSQRLAEKVRQQTGLFSKPEKSILAEALKDYEAAHQEYLNSKR